MLGPVYDADPTLKQHRLNASCLLRIHMITAFLIFRMYERKACSGDRSVQWYRRADGLPLRPPGGAAAHYVTHRGQTTKGHFLFLPIQIY